MSRCEFHALLSAYHDGELPEDRRAALEAHLAGCPDCAPELQQLAVLSDQLRSAELRTLRPIDKARIRENVANAANRAVSPAAHRARWLTAAAAVLFLVSVTQIILMNYRNNPSAGDNQNIRTVDEPSRSSQTNPRQPTHPTRDENVPTPESR